MCAQQLAENAKFSVLGKAKPSDVMTEPYGHMVLENALDQKLYKKLEAEFPSPEQFTSGLDKIDNNQAIRISTADVIGNSDFSQNWQDFFSYHTSEAFWQKIAQVFGYAIRAEHPGIEDVLGKSLEDLSVKYKHSDKEADITLDLKFVVNTPVQKMSSVRPAHVDAKSKIFAGLFYMKAPDDPTPGGDFALYKFKNGSGKFGGHYADLSALSEEKLIDYGSNKFVAFINSPRSIHGVTPRHVTPHFRRYINFVASLPEDVFELQQMSYLGKAQLWLSQLRHKAKGVNRKL